MKNMVFWRVGGEWSYAPTGSGLSVTITSEGEPPLEKVVKDFGIPLNVLEEAFGKGGSSIKAEVKVEASKPTKARGKKPPAKQKS